MVTVALLVRLEAKPGKEADVESFRAVRAATQHLEDRRACDQAAWVDVLAFIIASDVL